MQAYWLMFAFFALGALLSQPPVPVPVPDAQGRGQAEPSSMPLLFAALLLIVMIGLRYAVGGDWGHYLDAYKAASRENLFEAVSQARMEFGYTTLNWLVAQLGAGVWLVNLCCAALFTVGLVRLSRHHLNPWLPIVIATPYLVIVVAMGFTRQAAAIGALMLGMDELIRKKSIRMFVAYALIGAAFHKTVLIFLPVMLVTTTRHRFTAVALGGLAALVGYLLIVRGGADVYQAGYLRTTLDAAGARVRVLMNVVAAVVLLLSRDRMYATVEEKRIWRTFAYLALAAGAVLPLVHSSVIVDRLAMYLIPLQMFVFSRLTWSASKTSSSRLAVTSLVILYSAAVLFVWLNYAVNAQSWLPYRNYLWRA